jgi:hypothetical protein
MCHRLFVDVFARWESGTVVALLRRGATALHQGILGNNRTLAGICDPDSDLSTVAAPQQPSWTDSVGNDAGASGVRTRPLGGLTARRSDVGDLFRGAWAFLSERRGTDGFAVRTDAAHVHWHAGPPAPGVAVRVGNGGRVGPEGPSAGRGIGLVSGRGVACARLALLLLMGLLPLGRTAEAQNWTLQTTPFVGGLPTVPDNDWRSVAGGQLMSSTDGVTFAVASGGGSITGANATTNASGVATVGSWTLGATARANTLTATVDGRIGSPVTFTANRTLPDPCAASSAGCDWTIRTSAADIEWESETYGNGLFVAVAASRTGNRVMTSPDGTRWTSRSNHRRDGGGDRRDD